MLLQIIPFCLIFAGIYLLLRLLIADHRANRLPNRYVLPLLCAGVALSTADIFTTLIESFAGIICGYLSIRSIYTVLHWFGGNPDFGYGDAKLMAALGGWFGHSSLPFFLLFAALATLIIYPRRAVKPFGVGLVITAFGFISLSAVSQLPFDSMVLQALPLPRADR